MVDVAGLEPLLDSAVLHLDRDAMRPGHHRGERLRAAHAAETAGQDPLALEVAAEVLAAHFGEGLVGALDDALAADVDPRSGRHLAVHHQALAIEFVELLPGRPFGDEVGVGEEHARRILVGAEHADRLARLDEQGLVFLQPLQRLDDLVVAGPVARRAADAAVDDQALRVLGDLIVEVVHQHPDRGLGGPMPGLDLGAPPRADMAAVVASVGGHGSSWMLKDVGRPVAPASYFVIPAKAGISFSLCYRDEMRGGWTYIMTNRPRGVLYIGVTANLASRVGQHRNGEGSKFCTRYKLTRLVLAEQHDSIEDAIAREKAMKAWQRDWKIELIEQGNPQWLDLWNVMNGLSEKRK